MKKRLTSALALLLMASLLVTGCSLGKSGDQESSAPGVTMPKKWPPITM